MKHWAVGRALELCYRKHGIVPLMVFFFCRKRIKFHHYLKFKWCRFFTRITEMLTQIGDEEECRKAANFYSIIRCCHVTFLVVFPKYPPPLVSRTQSIVVWRMSVPLLCLLQGWSEWHMRVTDKNTALCSGSPRYHNMVLWVLRTQTDTRTRVKMSSQTARGTLLVGSEPTWAPSLYSAFRKEDLSTQLRSDDS